MVKLVLTGLWVCAITLASVYFSVQMATAPAVDPNADKKQQEYVAGETVSIPVIDKGGIGGYFVTKISYMMGKEQPKEPGLPLTELATDELYTLLVGNKVVDLAHTDRFDLAAFRADIKKGLNERLGGEFIANVLVEQLGYLSKDELSANQSAPVKKNLKPRPIVEGMEPPPGAVLKAAE
ncbi:hypothetical protein [Rhizobium sp. RAF56]|jgi:hypothetical protein|uniref:hypothetical protein n=1 Tax=Rhizobium sp. RAF56 TaxID=3233062 RepID=UPI003F9559A8